ncbi:MAG TPA: hypothetical protein VHT51_10625 [Micropepsaceae bacterium]|nr:hypothetical protein [Micropepsaceae bacterium]
MDIRRGAQMGYDNRLDREPVSKKERWVWGLLLTAVLAVVFRVAFF